jgi:nucleoside-diphosphate-sugar epimerase
MKALVTGATWFTGSTLAKKLCSQGIEVRVLARDGSKAQNMFAGLDIDIVQGDIADPAAVDKAVRGADKVYHVAAIYRSAGIPDQTYRDVHVKGTENVLNASAKHHVDRVVHCSTVGVHGHIANPPADEQYPFGPGDIYQATKLEGEQKAFEFLDKTGLPISVIRPCAIYGPGDMRLFKLFKLASKKRVLLLGSGKITYHMVYVDDLVDAFILAAEKEKAVGQAFIIGGEERLDLNALIDLIADINGIAPVKTIHLPAKPFQLAGSLVESICIPLRIEPPIYRRRVDFFTKNRAFDISKAKKQLGYSPGVSLRQGLSETARWYREQGVL